MGAPVIDRGDVVDALGFLDALNRSSMFHALVRGSEREMFSGGISHNHDASKHRVACGRSGDE